MYHRQWLVGLGAAVIGFLFLIPENVGPIPLCLGANTTVALRENVKMLSRSEFDNSLKVFKMSTWSW